ncbi:hypothetical protein [Deinococcus ruber]|uniref:hypothetical protein n=1 Tax=Deinococcus ruber TaxID=1848197 RepID=UPI001663AA63|nr:hypothetical protein [Deinococcus ruber]
MLLLPGLLSDVHDTREAKARVREMLCGFPAYYTLEEGECNGLHAHILIPVELMSVLEGQVWTQRLDPKRGGLLGKLKYLSKPRLWMACHRNHRRAVRPLFQLIADETLLTARRYALEAGRKRLPASSGTMNLPNRIAVPPALLLLLLYSLADLHAERERNTELATSAKRAVIVACLHRLRQRRVRPAVRRHAPLCWPVSSLPVRRAVLLSIGHARPPPQRKPRSCTRFQEGAATRKSTVFSPLSPLRRNQSNATTNTATMRRPKEGNAV